MRGGISGGGGGGSSEWNSGEAWRWCILLLQEAHRVWVYRNEPGFRLAGTPPGSSARFSAEILGGGVGPSKRPAETPVGRFISGRADTYADIMHDPPPPDLPPSVPPPLRPPPYPPPYNSPLHFGSLRSTDSSLRSTRGPTPAPPLNNKTRAVATHRLVCAPPCVWTAEPSLQLASFDAGASPRTPLKYQDSCSGHTPPCVCTALCVRRLVCGQPNSPCSSLRSTRGAAPAPPLHNKPPAVATHHLVCAPPCVCTTLGMHRLVCGEPNLFFAPPPPPGRRACNAMRGCRDFVLQGEAATGSLGTAAHFGRKSGRHRRRAKRQNHRGGGGGATPRF